MQVRINLLQGDPPRRNRYRLILPVIALTVPFIFTSCSIFKPRPDDGVANDPGQVYQSQRARRPDLMAPDSSYGNPPFWYRGRRIHPETLSPEQAPEAVPSLETGNNLPENFFEPPEIYHDDMDRASLRKVLFNQLQAMRLTDPSKAERMGDLMVTRGWLEETLRSFLRLIDLNLPPDEFSRRLNEQFIVHRVGRGKYKQILFTGYYSPVLKASRVRTEEYRYPLYRLPEAAPQVRLVGNGTAYEVNESSSPGARQWRQYTRAEIDRDGILRGRGLEIAWLKDDLDRFFLHIQGSGELVFTDGSVQGVRFAGVNNYKYGGLGTRMVEDGVIDLAQGSMQGIKQYFRENPEDMANYFYQNQRYIFFSLTEDGTGPLGSGGAELVGGRSFATDKRFYPAGGLAFVQIRKPILDDNDEILRWEEFSRFMVDQDTGNAIRGTGRADFYFGLGDRAGAAAGHFHEWGDVFYLVKKKAP